MSENKTNSNPLWRELNESRTQGEWATSGDVQIRHKQRSILIAQYHKHLEANMPYAETKANAQYTALAVNNFARIAEALTRIREASLQGLEMAANGEKFSFETLAGFVAEISGEALTAIS